MRVTITLLAIVPTLAAALCECGYSAQDPGGSEAPWVFADQLESDFTKTQNISKDTAWKRQEFNVSAEDGRGKYAKMFVPDNVVAGPYTAQGEKPGHEGEGLELHVGSEVQEGAVHVSEIDSARLDLHWGSYRTGMKLTDINGTCASFFWYFNDTQEIDIEFLSRELDRDNKVFPVNLVIQSKSSMEAGFDASATGTYKRVELSFDPTEGFHEYRFDYVPGHVYFYADSQLLADMQGDGMPSSPGHLILQHWSNGNPLWSGGPPQEDALLTVSYVKAYFNSSDARRQSDLARLCAESADQDGSGSVCSIPDVVAANATTGGTFFSQTGGVGVSNDTDDSVDTGGSEEDDLPGKGDEGDGGDDEESEAACLILATATVMWALITMAI